MKRIAAFVAAIQLALLGASAQAQSAAVVQAHMGAEGASTVTSGLRTTTVERWVEEWNPATESWERISDVEVTPKAEVAPRAAARNSKPAAFRGPAPALARYGPFMVTSATRAAMIGPTDSSTPRHFDAMLRDFPALALLEMIEAPGTSNDIANLAVGRRIRAAGIATHVPRGGSVRSGAVELFLAGAQRTIEDGAQFAVHSWLDNHGREADDFAANDPAHRLYLDYYVEMGMSEARARDFYAMTNSVPHASALWLVADDMRYWLRPERRTFLPEAPTVAQPVVIAYSDLSGVALAQLSFGRITLAQLDSGHAFP